MPVLGYKFLISWLNAYIEKYIKGLISKNKKIDVKQLTQNFYYGIFSWLRDYIFCDRTWCKKETLIISSDIWSLLWCYIDTRWTDPYCEHYRSGSLWWPSGELLIPCWMWHLQENTHDFSLYNCSTDVCLRHFPYVCLVRWIMGVNHAVCSTFAITRLWRT